jgi:hypothetical protein
MERLILKARVDGIDFAPVITTLDDIEKVAWVEQPVTLRDDEVSITEGDPEEREIYSHENDAPEDYDVTGGGLSCVGSFIGASYDQMAALMGGSVTGEKGSETYLHSSKKRILEKAIRFRLKNGGSLIIPCAKGTVQFNVNAGKDGLLKCPFKFRALAQNGFDTDLIVS